MQADADYGNCGNPARRWQIHPIGHYGVSLRPMRNSGAPSLSKSLNIKLQKIINLKGGCL